MGTELSKRRVVIVYDGSEYMFNVDKELSSVVIHHGEDDHEIWTPRGGFSNIRTPD